MTPTIGMLYGLLILFSAAVRGVAELADHLKNTFFSAWQKSQKPEQE